MAFFFDLSVNMGLLELQEFFKNINYYINNETKILTTVYFEDTEYDDMLDFVNKIILVKKIKVETFYTDEGHFLYCTKEYEKKEINFLNFKKVILKNIQRYPESIQKLVKKIDKNKRFCR